MPMKRVLVDCAVLSLQDACVFYPYCQGCFSKMDPKPQQPKSLKNTFRGIYGRTPVLEDGLSCFRCGYSCFKEQVDYRYRLSMKVARNTCIFGVTVFGTCLNPFFGIHASGLQRLVEDLNGPVEVSTRSTLLRQAVQDCFIGRHFIFGIKVTETENALWLEGTPVSSGNNMVQFTASQMILPKVRCLEGCTVVTYYRTLVQKAAEYELESGDLCRSSKPPVGPLMLVPHDSSNSSWCNATLCASGFLSQSLRRSQQQDSVLSPTPPWQQSLGLVTSSAEQEESCGTQDKDGHRRIISDTQTPHGAKTGTAETRSSCLLSAQSSFSNSPSFPQCSFLEKAAGNTPVLPCVSPSPSGLTTGLRLSSKAKALSAQELTQTILTDSVILENLPFSESLTEFLCDEDKGSEKIRKTEQNLKESRMFLDAVNDGGDRHDECVNMSRLPEVCLRRWNQPEEAADSEKDKEGSVYNCSADLFSCSSDMDNSTKMHHSVHLESTSVVPGVIRTTQTPHTHSSAEVRSLRCNSNKDHRQNGNAHVTHSTPDKPDLNRSRCNRRDSFGSPDYLQALEFIPPSQSTPVVKVSLISGLCEKPQNISFPVCKVNRINSKSLESVKENVVCSTTDCRHSNKLTPKRSFWKSDRHKVYHQAQQQLRFGGGALNTGSRRRMNHKVQSHVPDVSVCDYEDKEGIVPPTPAAKTHGSTKMQRHKHANAGRFPRGGPGAGEKKSCCKRKLLEQTVRTESDHIEIESHVCSLPCNGEKSERDFTAADKEGLEGCSGDENQDRDCSRDLFV